MTMRPPVLIARANTQRGMALLEVLVSVLLFSLGLLGLVGLQARAINFSVEAEDRNRAALFANELASFMWLHNTTVVDTATGTTSAPSWLARARAQLGADATVEVTKVDAMVNSADIKVTWKPPQRSTTESDTSQLITRVTLPPPAS